MKYEGRLCFQYVCLPAEGGIPALRSQVLSSRGEGDGWVPQPGQGTLREDRGIPLSQDKGYPFPPDRRVSIARLRTVSLLRSRRRTFLPEIAFHEWKSASSQISKYILDFLNDSSFPENCGRILPALTCTS